MASTPSNRLIVMTQLPNWLRQYQRPWLSGDLTAGLILLVAGVLRLGFLAYFLSHPVISGFISGSAILIAMGQLKYLLGISLPGGSVIAIVSGLFDQISSVNGNTALIGIAALIFLFFSRSRLAPLLKSLGVPAKLSELLTKLAPMAVVIVSTTIVATTGLDQSAQVAVVGSVPSGLPAIALPSIDWQQTRAL